MKGTISMTIYLYVKTHNKTGLKYLGKTIRDPYVYKGSGKRWTSHIKAHGYDVTTTILKECFSKDELAYWGLYYSELWDIVNSTNWANCTNETGSGGATVPRGTRIGSNNPMFGKSNPCTSVKSRTISKTKNLINYERYKTAILMLLAGCLVKDVIEKLKIGKGTISALKQGTHGVFECYPELIIYKNKLNELDRTPGNVPTPYLYEKILSLIDKGTDDQDIIKLIRKTENRIITKSIIDKLRDRTHRIFKIYPFIK